MSMYVWVCIYEYVCMSMYVWVCMYDYVCICMYEYACMHACMHDYVCMYVWMYGCMYVSMYLCIYVCIYVSMYLCMYLCIYVCICICICICNFKCMSAHTHTHLQSPFTVDILFLSFHVSMIRKSLDSVLPVSDKHQIAWLGLWVASCCEGRRRNLSPNSYKAK